MCVTWGLTQRNRDIGAIDRDRELSVREHMVDSVQDSLSEAWRKESVG